MYILIGMIIFGVLWMGLITRTLLNLRRDDEMKQLNRKYNIDKINELKKQINGKDNYSRPK